MIIVNGNLMETGIYVIAHQVNTLGIMGGGVAKQIRDKYPYVYNEYIKYCSNKTDEQLLGDAHCTRTEEWNAEHYIINAFGQSSIGVGARQTDYDALDSALAKGIQNYRCAHNNFGTQIPIAIPYMIGCGLAGGNIETVIKILEDIEKVYNVVFIAYKLN